MALARYILMARRGTCLPNSDFVSATRTVVTIEGLDGQHPLSGPGLPNRFRRCANMPIWANNASCGLTGQKQTAHTQYRSFDANASEYLSFRDVYPDCASDQTRCQGGLTHSYYFVRFRRPLPIHCPRRNPQLIECLVFERSKKHIRAASPFGKPSAPTRCTASAKTASR